MRHYYIIKLFPEITVKSKPVRNRMTAQLVRNLRQLLASLSPDINVDKGWDKLDVSCPSADVALITEVERILAETPGVANFSRVLRYPLGDFDDILEKAKSLWSERLRGKTFVVRVKRSGKHQFGSTDVEQYLGGGLLHQTGAAGVQMKGADITVNLEIRDETLYLIEKTEQGLGGFPLGSQDSVLSLVSGGFDSTVASFHAIRRGLRTHFLFFNLGGRAHEVGVREVSHYLWERFGRSHKARFIAVPFEEVVAEILANVDNSYMGVVLKRMMLRAAERVAEALDVEALVTGESVAQVSSQTLANLAAIDQVAETLVLRPLITTDKTEIIDTARRIGTEEFAANMPEYCGVISVKPTTRARLDRLAEAEASFDVAKLEQAVANRTEQCISRVLEDMPAKVDVDIFKVPQPDSVILDIRHPDDVERRPLNAGSVKVEPLPFYKLQSGFGKLDGKIPYLLYCDKGVMSRLHAELLKEQGADNVAVYRPF